MSLVQEKFPDPYPTAQQKSSLEEDLKKYLLVGDKGATDRRKKTFVYSFEGNPEYAYMWVGNGTTSHQLRVVYTSVIGPFPVARLWHTEFARIDPILIPATPRTNQRNRLIEALDAREEKKDDQTFGRDRDLGRDLILVDDNEEKFPTFSHCAFTYSELSKVMDLIKAELMEVRPDDD